MNSEIRIDEIYLKGVGPFEEVHIPFKRGMRSDLADVYLLTGTNGSGKSTILYALAGIVGSNHLGQDFGARRLRTQDSVAAILMGDYIRASAWRNTDRDRQRNLNNPFGTAELTLQVTTPIVGYYQSASSHPLHTYWQEASRFNISAPVDANSRFSWAAFAYAGMRSVNDVKVTAIREPDYSPFEQSLSFTNTANTERLAHWIANQDFKRLKAKENGRLDRAKLLAESIQMIERAISDIIGEPFVFVMSDADNDVRVRRGNAVIDLGLLPDGLKSIVSWIADLLMRLDRIPWIDDTPPMKRNFLLMLDEVDIHLHPSWQRRVLPIVQRLFPNAQIIASTHSPFVVASAQDAQIITFHVENGISRLESISPSREGISYSVVLRSIFGIENEFDVETEKLFKAFHEAKRLLLSGDANRAQVDELANKLASRSEEVRELIAIEQKQIERQLNKLGK